MTSHSSTSCPACGAVAIPTGIAFENQPVLCHQLCPTADQARNIPRGDILLSLCTGCGLVFNRAFEPDLITYNADYDNSQGHSKVFRHHMRALAERLIASYGLNSHSHVLEIGCGKGDFLRLLRELCGCRGTGYDTTYSGEEVTEGPLRFFKRYASSRNDFSPADLIVCRHVVEHIPAIGGFLAEVRGIAEKCGASPVVFETPALEWIAKNGAFWDVCYEHCNYFTMHALAGLGETAGLRPTRHWLAFSDQYQILETSCSRPQQRSESPSSEKLIHELKHSIQSQFEAVSQKADGLNGNSWVIWGAGAKGISLAMRISSPPMALVDENPSKQGGYAPRSAVPVISPKTLPGVQAVLVANPAYEEEIRKRLNQLGSAATTFTL